MLGIVNAKWGNALKSSMQDERMLGNRQYVRKKYSENSMQGDTMLGNRQYVRKKYSESTIQGKKVLRIVNVRRENARNPQYTRKNARNRKYTQRKYLESAMCVWKNARNRKYM